MLNSYTKLYVSNKLMRLSIIELVCFVLVWTLIIAVIKTDHLSSSDVSGYILVGAILTLLIRKLFSIFENYIRSLFLISMLKVLPVDCYVDASKATINIKSIPVIKYDEDGVWISSKIA